MNWQIDQIGTAFEINGPRCSTARHGRDPRHAHQEDAADYRFFLTPTCRLLIIAPRWVERVKGEMPELPRPHGRALPAADGLPAYDATAMTQSLDVARYYRPPRPRAPRQTGEANWIMGEVSKRLNSEGLDITAAPVKPAVLAQLIGRISDGTISNNGAKQVFEALWSGEGQDVDAIIVAKDLKRSTTPARSAHPRRGAGGQPEVGGRVPLGQGEGLQRAGRPGHEGHQRQGHPPW